MPFRLVGVFPSEQEIWEWRWDSAQLEFQVHEWESRHWFSSSLSDERAESLRGAACRTLHATNRTPAPCAGCEDFTLRTQVDRGHSVCASTGKM